MHDNTTYVLIHSPLVGPFTWDLVGHELEKRGFRAIWPAFSDLADSTQPFWKQQSESIANHALSLTKVENIVLVAHSGAGPLMPAIRQQLKAPVRAYVFVDAGIPRNGFSRLDLMKVEDPEWAEQLYQALSHGEQYPTWKENDLSEIVPDPEMRRRLVEEIHPRSLPFFIEPIPVFEGWPDAPCTYVKFSSPYDKVAEYARQAGWPVRELSAGHFHMLVQPSIVAQTILDVVRESQRPKSP